MRFRYCFAVYKILIKRLKFKQRNIFSGEKWRNFLKLSSIIPTEEFDFEDCFYNYFGKKIPRKHQRSKAIPDTGFCYRLDAGKQFDKLVTGKFGKVK